MPSPSTPPSVPHRRHSLRPQKDHHSPSSPPGSSSTSTVPLAELASEVSKASVDRCVYFHPPPTTRGKGEEQKLGTREEEEQRGKAGLRRFFFGDSPQLRRPPPHSLPPRQFDKSICVGANVPISPTPSVIRVARPMLSRKRTFGGISLSSRTISVDFDSETLGTTDGAERTHFMHQCNGGKAEQQQSSNNAHRTHQSQAPMEAPNVVARQQQPNYYQPQQQQSQFSGAQFDTQSLQSRSRTRSIGNHNHHTLPPNVSHHRQHSSGGFRHGSCTNLSTLDGSNAGAGPLVLYNGGGIDGEFSPTTTAPHRHSMALIDAPMPAPFWYHQPMLHPPPPPFYYSAATLPHPPPPMDLATFRRALKESERMEKGRKMLVGEQGQCALCWEFCCGGSAIVLWLVITLIALGFLGFLILAIYFL